MFDTGVFSFILLTLAGFAAMLTTFTPIANKYSQTLQIKPTMLPFSYIYLFYAFGTFFVYYFFEHNDFIEPLTKIRAFTPLLFAAVIFISSMFCSGWRFGLIIFGCVTITVFLQPLGEGFSYGGHNILIDRLILIVFFSIFCIFYGVLNFLPHIVIIPSIITLFGMAVLFLFSAAPFYITLCSALLVGALGGYLCINLNTIKVPLDNGSCCALAYLIASLMLLDSGEYSFSSCVIFTMFFWSELAFAIWNKFAAVKSGALFENTNCAQAAYKYDLNLLVRNIAKICGVNLLIGWFQLFAINQYSLAIISFCIVSWLSYIMLHPVEGNIKKINQEFIADIKKNISDIHNDIKSLKTPEKKTKTGKKRKTSVKKKEK